MKSMNTRIRDGILASFRSTPSTAEGNLNLIAALQGGTPVTILSMEGNWYYCEVGGMQGYLHKSCIAFE